ncbi:hypothetical protein BN1013_00310 [Candidatus Rubidus massiliensis]|nr:hypothetical protein BN1013_00310 [Candidatus Rubidus massiliensis]
MNPKKALFIKVLANHFNANNPISFFDVLPKEQSDLIQLQDVESEDPKFAFLNPKKFFDKEIHYSWLKAVLHEYPTHLQKCFIATLPKALHERIKKLMGLSDNIPVVNDRMQVFLQAELMKKSGFSEILPKEFIPRTSLSPLLEISKNELLEVINYLGLFDLAHTIRHVLDKKTLNKIYSCLNVSQQGFLKVALHQKDRIHFPKLALEKIDNAKTMNQQLHRRGLLRLGKSIAMQDRDFIWYLCHKLDTGRGELLEKYASQKEKPLVVTILSQQIQLILRFLFKKKSHNEI